MYVHQSRSPPILRCVFLDTMKKQPTTLEWWKKKQAAAQRRQELREQAIKYLGGRCRICGYNRCPAAFDFHHVEMLTKDFTISAAMTSWERIRPELDKCVLLCATCHREVHAGLHPDYIDHDGGHSMYDLELLEEEFDGFDA